MPKTADIIAHALYEEGVRHAFGIPGGEVLELLEAFRKVGIKFVLTKQEMGAGMMADAYWQLTGKPGVLVATVGPGVVGSTPGVAQALLDRAAMIVIGGDIPRNLKGAHTRKVIDQESLLRPLVKWATTIAAKNAFDQVRSGIAIAKTPLPGPVYFNLPADIAGVEQDEARRFAPAAVRTLPRREDIALIQAWLKKARRPLACIGMNAQLDGAERELKRFLEAWHIPFLTTYKAKGVVAEDHPLCVGATGLSPVVDKIHLAHVRHADLVLTIGFDPVELHAEWNSPWDEKKATVNIDLVPNTHHVYRSAVEYTGSIAGCLHALAAHAPKRAPAHWPVPELERYRQTIKHAIASQPSKGLGPYQVATVLREVFPRDTIATVDTGAHRILVSQVWQSYEPRRFLQSSGLSTMGYALPAAIAAKMLFPKRPVLAMAGEAGLDMVIGEMALLAQHKLALTIVVFRDDTLSLIKLKQQRMKLPETGVVTGSPDYVMLAEAYGGNGFVETNPAELKKAAQVALHSKRFTLIEARINPAEYQRQM